jgi:phosphatidylserine/phosphatidylglycerophosphate/cardiolipin synthase-like enzyme
VITFVTTPTYRWLQDNLLRCESRLLVSSPYVSSVLENALKNAPHDVETTLLTRTNLRDFATGASDIDALCNVARNRTQVLSLSRLHAKVYIIDDAAALVTSANATTNGMFHNWECGVSFTDPSRVQELRGILLAGFGASTVPLPWTIEELEQLREPIRILRAKIPPVEEAIARGELDALPLTVTRTEQARLVSEFSGWLQLTLEGVVAQSDNHFTLNELETTCRPLATARYPQNKHVRPKIRQQLQRLRDLGLVEFLGGGRYRRLVSPST